MLVALTLLPSLQAIPNSRLVLQSSELHRAPLSSTRFTSLDETDTNLGPKSLYSRTNLAQILFVRALVCRWMNNEPGFQAPENTGPWVNTTHPGVVSTDQPAQAIEAYGTKAKISAMTVKPFSKEPADEGCMSALFAATSEYFVTEKIQVQYIVPDRKVTDPSKQAQNEELGEKPLEAKRATFAGEARSGVVPTSRSGRNWLPQTVIECTP